MKKLHPLLFYDKQHIHRILIQQNAVGLAFSNFITEVSKHLQKWNNKGGDSVWVRNSAIEKEIDRAASILYSALYSNIEDFQLEAWKRSNDKNDDMLLKFIKGLSISTVRKEGMFRHNMEALSAFQKNVNDNGLSTSQKVWKITEQAKKNLEFYLRSGISAGRSAEGISRDIRQMLNEPNKRFRRVRDENGVLQLSKPMKDYHPGAGVYRSSRMNALRLAATQTNMAYRKADYERWARLDFILGIKIDRSPSNRGPCRICDSMIGIYPKDIQFLGFHPFCQCIATPMLPKHDEMADFLIYDELPDERFVKDIPGDARKFILDNEYMQKSYMYRNNKIWFSE